MLGQTPGAASANGSQTDPAPDPAGGEPLGAAASSGVLQALGRHAPEIVRSVGIQGVQEAVGALAELPRDVVRVLDGEGFFTKELSWQLLSRVARNSASAGPDAGLADEVTVDALAEHARAHGLDGSLEALDGLARFANALPPKVRAGVSHAMARDPSLWATVAKIGSKMFGLEMKRRK